MELLDLFKATTEEFKDIPEWLVCKSFGIANSSVKQTAFEDSFHGKYSREYVARCRVHNFYVHVYTLIAFQRVSELEERIKLSSDKMNEIKQIFSECQDRNDFAELGLLLRTNYSQYENLLRKETENSTEIYKVQENVFGDNAKGKDLGIAATIIAKLEYLPLNHDQKEMHMNRFIRIINLINKMIDLKLLHSCYAESEFSDIMKWSDDALGTMERVIVNHKNAMEWPLRGQTFNSIVYDEVASFPEDDMVHINGRSSL
jgi:hypothetical protein